MEKTITLPSIRKAKPNKTTPHVASVEPDIGVVIALGVAEILGVDVGSGVDFMLGLGELRGLDVGKGTSDAEGVASPRTEVPLFKTIKATVLASGTFF